MSAETNKTITRRIFETVFNTGNLSNLDELAAPDLQVHYPGAAPLGGLDRYKEIFAAERPAFPDEHYTIEDMVAEGDRVVVRWTMRATHKGVYQGVAPTGKQVTMTGMSLYRFAEGKVAEAWVGYDALGMLQQIGAVPQPQQV